MFGVGNRRSKVGGRFFDFTIPKIEDAGVFLTVGFRNFIVFFGAETLSH